MKRTLVAVLAVAALTRCNQTAKVAVEPPPRRAIAIAYVAAPMMSVRNAPADAAEEITRYGINETVSVLARKGDWTEVRTVDGSGWVKQADLMTAEQAQTVADNPLPRFLQPPVPIPDARARGEVDLQAKVNTDGQVVEVQVAKNTTGNAGLATANAQSLLESKFYPMVQKGQRMTFTYEHRISY